jgi:hypothetical protein
MQGKSSLSNEDIGKPKLSKERWKGGPNFVENEF